MADDEEIEETMENTTIDPAGAPEPETTLSRGTSVITIGKNYQGVPFPQIEELTGNHSEIWIRLQRRNAKGQIATLEGGLILPTAELATIEVWGKQRHGGGSFRCEVRDPQYPTRTLFSFDFVLEGMPKMEPSAQNVPAPGGMTPATMPRSFVQGGTPWSAPPAIPAGAPHRSWAEGLPPHERAAYLASMGLGAPVAQHASDQIALDIEARTRVELEKVRAKSEARTKELELELEKARAEALANREAAKEAAHQAEIRALAAKIDAMGSRPPERGMADTIAALAPLVPFGVAWLQSNAQQQQAQLQHQQAGFQTMIAAATPKQQPDSMKELLTIFAPIVTPLLGKALDRDSPDAQAKLYQALSESQMNMVSMMANLVQETAPPAPSPVGAAVQTMLEGLRSVAVAYMTGQGGLPGQLPAGRQPAGVMRAAAAIGGSYATMDDEAHTGEVVDTPPAKTQPAAPSQAAQAPKPPPAEVEALFGMLPADFQSMEWRTILTGLHSDPPAPVKQISTLLAGHLEHLANFGALPTMLAGILTNPRPVLEAVLEKLPVAATNPAYAMQVLDTTLAFLMEDGFVPKPEAAEVENVAGDGEDDKDEGDGENAAAE